MTQERSPGTVTGAAASVSGGRLVGKNAIITGASSGIGEAAARLFVAEGGSVAMVARNQEALEAIADDLGDAAIAVPLDITRPDDVAAMVERVDAELGGIDIAVNSAGVAITLPLAETDAATWQQVIDINLSASFYIARETGLRMLAGRGGVIINIGSEMSMMGFETMSAYCASKWGLIGMTKALAAELAPTIRVNAVCPGPTETPMCIGYFERADDPQAVHDMTLARIKLGRLATPESVAAGILYLVADAPYATGAVLNLDGGTTI